MANQYPRRRLDDWSPDLGDLDDWLSDQADLGWEPEYGGIGTEVEINGQLVRRFAMIMRSPPEDADSECRCSGPATCPLYSTG